MIHPCRAVLAALLLAASPSVAQTSAPASQPEIYSGSPLQPEYPVPYRTWSSDEITAVLTRVLGYLETANPARAVDRETREPLTDLSQPSLTATLARGENNSFNTVCYEWGVTYSAMLHAAGATHDPRFAKFVDDRFLLISRLLPSARAQLDAAPAATAPTTRPGQRRQTLLRSVLAPRNLDDSGAMCAAMIKARRATVGPDLMPVIQTYIDFISNKQFRLADGTLARKGPQPETLWLDDLYMSVPALAQMGKLTGEGKYYDDAARQILQFASRMFNRNKGIWMHGWATNAPEHPEFHWARANGWAIMATIELLEVLPGDHPQRGELISLLQSHIKGLASYQSGEGRWHNLLDRNDSYLETSASAMFVYGIARAINRGWVSAPAFGPVAQTGWNAVAAQVNERGQVEQTCVGTSLAFEPVYYYARPRSPYALHGYGPVIHAGAEMIELVNNPTLSISRGVIQFVPKPRED